MKIVKMKDGKNFGLANLSFTDLKTIKDACELFASQGSAHAKKLLASIEKEMENVTV
jgi:hypothetical protein